MRKNKEVKLKVGRPKLADNGIKKNSMIMALSAIILSLALLIGGVLTISDYSSISMLKGASTGTYNLKFAKPLNATGKMENQTISIGKTEKINKHTYTISTGYHFLGWKASRLSDKKAYGLNSSGILGWYDASSIKEYFYIPDNSALPKDFVSAGDTVALFGETVSDNTVSIKYNNSRAEKGTGFMPEQYIQYNKENKISTIAYKNKGFVFRGWIAQRVSDGKYYGVKNNVKGWYGKDDKSYAYVYFSNNATIPANFVNKDDKLRLFADWVNTIKIQYLNQQSTGPNAKGSMASQTIIYGNSYSISNLGFINSGYTFQGWILQRTNDGKYYGIKNNKVGWYGKSDAPYQYSLFGNNATLTSAFLMSNVSKNGTIKLYASWRKDSVPIDKNQYSDNTKVSSTGTYEIKYTSNCPNNRRSSSTTITAKVDQYVTLKNPFTCSGYELNSLSGAMRYYNGESVKNLAKPGKTVTIKVNWQQKKTTSSGSSSSKTATKPGCTILMEPGYCVFYGYTYKNNKCICK